MSTSLLLLHPVEVVSTLLWPTSFWAIFAWTVPIGIIAWFLDIKTMYFRQRSLDSLISISKLQHRSTVSTRQIEWVEEVEFMDGGIELEHKSNLPNRLTDLVPFLVTDIKESYVPFTWYGRYTQIRRSTVGAGFLWLLHIIYLVNLLLPYLSIKGYPISDIEGKLYYFVAPAVILTVLLILASAGTRFCSVALLSIFTANPRAEELMTTIVVGIQTYELYIAGAYRAFYNDLF